MNAISDIFYLEYSLEAAATAAEATATWASEAATRAAHRHTSRRHHRWVEATALVVVLTATGVTTQVVSELKTEVTTDNAAHRGLHIL